MLVKDIMVENVIMVSSDTYVLDAEKTMELHKIGRLPVVDKGKLVGLITKDDVLKASPSSTSPYNQRQLFYLMSKLTIKEIMKTDVVTVSPDTTVEKAVAIAQKRKVGCLPVIEKGRVVGIVTTNDFFYKILNPLLGIGDRGKRIMVYDAGPKEVSQKVMEVLTEADITIKTSWIPPDPKRCDLILHLDTEDATPVITRLRGLGYTVDEREFTA